MKTVQILFFLAFAFSIRAATVLNFAGQGYIPQNHEWVFTPSANFEIGFHSSIVYQNPRNGIEFYTDGQAFNQSWSLILVGAHGEDLHVGRYENAQRFGSWNNPTMDFYGAGRGLNDAVGWFEILELTWGDNYRPTVLAVDFYSESFPNASHSKTTGSLRFNSDIPLSPVPEPSSALLILGTLLSLTCRRR